MRVAWEEGWAPPLTRPVKRYLVEVGGLRMLVDAGVDPLAGNPNYVLVTHYHWDHTLGLAKSRGLKICVSEHTLKLLEPGSYRTRVLKVAGLAGIPDSQVESSPVFQKFSEMYESIAASLEGHEIYELDSCPPVVRGLVTPVNCGGHSPDHTCYITNGLLFSGDHLLAGESPVTHNALEYIVTTSRILSQEWRRLYPGHGDDMERATAVEELVRSASHKMGRMLEVARLIGEGVRRLELIVEILYGRSRDPVIRYLQASNTLGYLRGLAEMGARLNELEEILTSLDSPGYEH
ncbi:MAG: MBL fold metallo-hydrolase [Aeropyrum sp.]|nr:MBL fold metallo-hydrolase [Aeropyrum sp.]